LLQIRNLALHDVQHVLAIQADCYAPFFHENEESFRAKIAASAQTCWLSLLNGKPVGYLIALPVSQHTFPSLSAPQFTLAQSPALLYLHDMAVLPAARSLRLGRQFIDAVIAAAKRCALPAVGLIAVQGSAAYWEKAGFRVTGDMPTSVSDKLASFGAGARYMERQIA
jgi:GNAT superfamily N-acetyltransferase